MTRKLILSNINTLSINGYKNTYFGLKKKNLLKKKKFKKKYIKNVWKIVIKNIKRFLKLKKKKYFKKRIYKPWYKKRLMRSKSVAITQLRSLYFLYGNLLKFKAKKKYKRRYKRFLMGLSRVRIKISGRQRPRFIKRRLMMKTPFFRRFSFIRLPRLFFFWFIILYNDLYFYLSKIIWNNWFKFLYASFGFNDYSKLFYKTTLLYNLNYNSSSFLFDNSLFFNNYNLNAFLNSSLINTLGSYGYFFFNGVFFYDLKYISLSSQFYVNLYIHKNKFTKKNIKLKRFFIYKV